MILELADTFKIGKHHTIQRNLLFMMNDDGQVKTQASESREQSTGKY